MNFNHKFRNKKGANDMGENISNGTLYDRVEEKRGSDVYKRQVLKENAVTMRCKGFVKLLEVIAQLLL